MYCLGFCSSVTTPILDLLIIFSQHSIRPKGNQRNNNSNAHEQIQDQCAILSQLPRIRIPNTTHKEKKKKSRRQCYNIQTTPQIDSSNQRSNKNNKKNIISSPSKRHLGSYRVRVFKVEVPLLCPRIRVVDVVLLLVLLVLLLLLFVSLLLLRCVVPSAVIEMC